MSIIELLFLAVALSMDAFAVSVCLGLRFKNSGLKNLLLPPLYFGAFQALMPMGGYFAGVTFRGFLENFTNIIAFILLLIIGLNMIKEAFEADDEEVSDDLSHKTLFLLAVATSIDALAVGFTFALLKVKLLKSVAIIGLTTFLISILGIKAGNFFGEKNRRYATIFGGVILILIGVKALLKL